jgi:hypothetical protein
MQAMSVLLVVERWDQHVLFELLAIEERPKILEGLGNERAIG